jgi:hypothetical protein
MRQILLLAAVLTLGAVPAQGQTVITDFVDFQATDRELRQQFGIEATQASLGNIEDAVLLLNSTIKARYGHLDIGSPDFYCIIHVLRWKEEIEEVDGEARAKQAIQFQNWYLYRGGRDWSETQFRGLRLLGTKQVYVLYVHLNDTLKDYTPRYSVEVKPKAPANVAALAELLKFLGVTRAAAPPLEAPTHHWGLGKVDSSELPADLAVTPAVQITSTEAIRSLGDVRTYDNEGLYFWDIAFGVPIRSVKQVSFTDDAATPQKIERNALFILLNVHVTPVDVKTSGLRRIPHFVFGVDLIDDLSGKPLDRIFLGGGWGPAFANFFAGRARLKLADGTDDWEWTFGLSVPIRGVIETLKKQ